jgi:hypothetical protein
MTRPTSPGTRPLALNVKGVPSHDIAPLSWASGVPPAAMLTSAPRSPTWIGRPAAVPVVGVASGAMVDRVPAGLGLLGPVDDTQTMADHVMKIWRGDHDAIGQAARAHVEARFSWDRTFERLLTDIYPKALQSAVSRRVTGGRPRAPIVPAPVPAS